MALQVASISGSLQKIETCCLSSSFYERHVSARLAVISLVALTTVTATIRACKSLCLIISARTVAWHQFRTCLGEAMAVALFLLIVIDPHKTMPLYAALSLYRRASRGKIIAKIIAISVSCLMAHSILWPMMRPADLIETPISSLKLLLGVTTAISSLFISSLALEIYLSRRKIGDVREPKKYLIDDLRDPQQYLFNEMESTAATCAHLQAARTALREHNGKSLTIVVLSPEEFQKKARPNGEALCDPQIGRIEIINTVSLISAVSWTVFELANMRLSREFHAVGLRGKRGELSRKEFGHEMELVEHRAGCLYTDTMASAASENPFYQEIAMLYLAFYNNPAECLRVQKLGGHTDSYYRQWDEHCAQAYRTKNPNDSIDRMQNFTPIPAVQAPEIQRI